MKKRFLVAAVLAAAALALCLAGCGGVKASSTPPAGSSAKEGLPAWIDEETATARAREVIDEFLAGDYEGVAARFDDASVSAGDFEKAAKQIEGVGSFVSYGDATFAQYDAEGDGAAAVVVQTANYGNGKLVYMVGLAEAGTLTAFRVQ